jgi:hypothetical protein
VEDRLLVRLVQAAAREVAGEEEAAVAVVCGDGVAGELEW